MRWHVDFRDVVSYVNRGRGHAPSETDVLNHPTLHSVFLTESREKQESVHPLALLVPSIRFLISDNSTHTDHAASNFCDSAFYTAMLVTLLEHRMMAIVPLMFYFFHSPAQLLLWSSDMLIIPDLASADGYVGG
jgi:hypothetical protein